MYSWLSVSPQFLVFLEVLTPSDLSLKLPRSGDSTHILALKRAANIKQLNQYLFVCINFKEFFKELIQNVFFYFVCQRW